MKFQPIRTQSATELLMDQLKTAILTGELRPGERLPSERDLEAQLRVSRAVINQALRRLQDLHFIRMIPRQGNFVADYRVDGTLTTLDQIVRFRGANYQPNLLRSIYQVRRVTEGDTVQLAAERQDKAVLHQAQQALSRFQNGEAPQEYAEHTFAFFRWLALASGNQVYPLLVNSFRPTYLTLSQWNSEHGGAVKMLAYNRSLLAAVQAGDGQRAMALDATLIDWSLANLLA